LRGYLETAHRMHVDTLFVFQAQAAHLTVLVFDLPAVVFHQLHDRGENIISDHPIAGHVLRHQFNAMRDSPFIPVNKHANWGLAEVQLPILACFCREAT